MRGLTYEPLQLRHAVELRALWADAAVIRYTHIPAPCTDGEILDRLRRLAGGCVFVVRRQGEFIGLVGCLGIDEGLKQYGLFYQLRESAWGQGLGTQAVAWLLAHMRERQPGAVLLADVVAANAASERILLRLGFSLLSDQGPFVQNGVNSRIRRYRLSL